MTSEKKKRREVAIDEATAKKLQKLADRDQRSLKSYMEKILTEHAKNTK